ncbi:MAG: extracellular solute-binding protein [Pseudomonadota bacterium]
MNTMLRLLSACLVWLALAVPVNAEPRHAIAMQGEPALTAGYSHFPYVNPDAPKGGALRMARTGSFDSVNPFIIKGQAVAGTRLLVFESLLARSQAEPFTLYGHIAETIDTNAERTEVTFRINPKAQFSDGEPIQADDVVYSLETLRDHGRPNHRTYYSKVVSLETPDNLTVRMKLEPGDRELVLILGLMPVLPRHVFEKRDFEQTTLDKLVGSGPYVFDKIDAGDHVIYRRNPNYWAKDLPSARGQFNYDTIRYDYYRDTQGAFEAFKKGEAMLRTEGDASRWAVGYADVKDKPVVLETIDVGLPKPAWSLVFNTRRAVFADKRVREALILTFDFEWINKNLFHDKMQRTQGFYYGSDLSAIGRPASASEREMLRLAGADIRTGILDGTFSLPVSDGSGRDRKNLRKALKLLNEAGWKTGTKGLESSNGEGLSFEITVANRPQERIALAWQRMLRTIGVDMTIRQVDSAQFQRRLQTYDFDMIPFTWSNSLSPGNEQAFYWGSQGRDQDGTRNYMGADDPAIDNMIAQLLSARNKTSFEDAVRGLDRLLLEGHYALQLFHPPGQWLARWNQVRRPGQPSLAGFLPQTGWIESQ